MEKILVSACLLGEKCRYDGNDNLSEAIKALGSKYDLVPFCPEVESGLGTPRKPVEIFHGMAKRQDGSDVTSFFNDGAQKALNICKFLGIRIAILKDYSPSCGVRQIHDGSFSGRKVPGQGFTAQFLSLNGIKVYCENDVLSFLIETPEQAAAREEKKQANIAKAKYKEERAASEKAYAEALATATAAGQPAPEKPAILTEPDPYAKAPKKEFHSFHKSNPLHKQGGYVPHNRPEGEAAEGNGGAKPSSEGGYHHDDYHSHSNYGHSSYGHKEGGYSGHSSYGHKEGGYSGHSSYGHKEGGYSGHSSYGHSSYGHGSYEGKRPYRPYHDHAEPSEVPAGTPNEASSAEGAKPAYTKKPYGHSSYGHSSYGHSSYGHKEGGYSGHSSYGHKEGGYSGHSSYGHKEGGYSGHSSYGHKEGGYSGHSSYGHSSYGHKEGGYSGHSSYKGSKPGYKKPYGHSSYKGGSKPAGKPEGDPKK
jgi:uncharacterized protein YbbK (DUF523 family)